MRSSSSAVTHASQLCHSPLRHLALAVPLLGSAPPGVSDEVFCAAAIDALLTLHELAIALQPKEGAPARGF
jgi:hypothetical protein